MLFDTHCHLDLPAFDGDREAVIARAQAAGVGLFLNPAFDLASSERAVALAAARPDVAAAVGIHPNEAESLDAAWERLAVLAGSPRVAALGEIGLDYHWDRAPRAAQAAAFIRQLGLARELGLPVIVHCRDAHQDTLDLLERHAAGLAVLLHAFSGDARHARRALDAGHTLGIGGPVTYKNAEALRQAVADAPAKQLVLETDAPYLPPHPHRGARNEPAYLALISEKVSQVRSVSLEEVAAATTGAARRLFGLSRE